MSVLGRLRVLSGRQVCVLLAPHGFQVVRQRGSHLIMQCVRDGRTVTVPIPDHKELATGTLASIIRQAGVDRREFEA